MKDKLIEKFKPFSARTISADTIKYRDDQNYGKGWHNTISAAIDYHTENNVKIALEAIIEALDELKAYASIMSDSSSFTFLYRELKEKIEHYQKALEELKIKE